MVGAEGGGPENFGHQKRPGATKTLQKSEAKLGIRIYVEGMDQGVFVNIFRLAAEAEANISSQIYCGVVGPFSLLAQSRWLAVDPPVFWAAGSLECSSRRALAQAELSRCFVYQERSCPMLPQFILQAMEDPPASRISPHCDVQARSVRVVYSLPSSKCIEVHAKGGEVLNMFHTRSSCP